MIVTKIISGGQTGADQGGLKAGKFLGIPTGGTAPQNFRTEAGPNYDLRDIYHLDEGEYDPGIYPKRTRKNIRDSDGTVVFGKINSAGTRLTLSQATIMMKPLSINPDSVALRSWLINNNIKILNVAGNRESKSKGIEDKTFQVIRAALTEYN